MEAIALGQQLTATDTRKARVMGSLRTFARQRPGLDPRNYISGWNDTEGRRAYFAEARSITRDLRHFQELLAAVESRNISADDLIRAADRRLTISEKSGYFDIEYITGQYWPTEYRAAACRVLASALWDYWRDNGCDTADKIRAEARRSLSRGVVSRWFN